MEILDLDFVKGFFTRNKKLLLLSLAIFIASFLIGFLLPTLFGDGMGAISNGLSNGTTTQNEVFKVTYTATEFFVLNYSHELLVIAGGLVFSLFSIFAVVYNGFLMGLFYGIDFAYSLVSVLPHGFFESCGMIFGLTGAFIITKLEIQMIKTRSFISLLKESKTELLDILLVIIFCAICYAIAAIIEAYVTGNIIAFFF